jgi:hypothetical protein
VGPPLTGHGWSGDSARYVARQPITRASGNSCELGGKRELDRALCVQSCRVEHGDRRVFWSHQQVDLRAAEQNRLRAATTEREHDSAVPRRPRVLGGRLARQAPARVEPRTNALELFDLGEVDRIAAAHARSRIPIRGAITELSCRATSRLIAR